MIEYKLNDVCLLQDGTCFVELKHIKVKYGNEAVEAVLPVSFIMSKEGKCLNVGELVSVKCVTKKGVMFASQSVGYFLCFDGLREGVQAAALAQYEADVTTMSKSDCEQLYDEIMRFHEQQAIERALANHDAQAFYEIVSNQSLATK